MSERSDRSLGNGRSLILAATIGLIVVAAAGGGYLWHRSNRPLPAPVPEQRGPQDGPSVRTEEPVQATLFVPVNGMLEPVVVGGQRQTDLQLEAREVVRAILAGERGSQAAVLKDFRLRALYVDASGTAFVDLAPAGQREVRASVWEELLAVYALVNTLTQNFAEIRQVRLLIDGREGQTLAGHLDLSRAFMKRTDLVRVH